MRRAGPFLAVAAAVLIGSCSTTTKPTSTTTETPTASPAAATTSAPMTRHAFIGAHGFDVGGMDTAVKACDNFYSYAVGKWRASHPLPPQYSRFGRFEELAERNRETLHKILEADAAQNAAAGSNPQKLGDFYSACMDETAIEGAGTTPIQPELARINGISDRQQLLAELTRLHSEGYAPLFRVGGVNDFKNSTMIIAALGAGSLGLPDRDYYLRDDARFSKIRSEYVVHVAKEFTALPGWLEQRVCVSDFARRYGTPMTSWRPPASQAQRDKLAIAYARDGYALLEAVYAPSSPAWLREIPAVETLRQVLLQNYTRIIGPGGREVVRRRRRSRKATVSRTVKPGSLPRMTLMPGGASSGMRSGWDTSCT